MQENKLMGVGKG